MVVNFKDVIVEFYSAKPNTSLKIKKTCEYNISDLELSHFNFKQSVKH